MTEFVIVFVLLLLVVSGMAIGVIVSNRRLKGSCGGLNMVPGLDDCPVCGKTVTEETVAACEPSATGRG